MSATIHNTMNDDTLIVPDFVAEKLLQQGKVFKCSECGFYHTDEIIGRPAKIMREAYKLAMN